LDAVARRGETFEFWWRDDDAGRESPALTRLLELADRQNAPLALAAVPAWLDAASQASIAASAECTVLQHGYAHVNHGKKGQKSIELGNRPVDMIAEELRTGRAILEDAFGAAFIPILVPPWNRIDRALHPHLSAWGFRGLSVFGKRADAEICPGVALVNTHLDPIDWRGTRGFVGEETMLARLLDHLDAGEPIGFLSHHLVMDEPCWSFLERLLSTLARHPAVRFCSAPSLLSATTLSDGQAA
jgi:peptidoglycan/xylan/chitin deacetylase (PgdA/CDA1 family)